MLYEVQLKRWESLHYNALNRFGHGVRIPRYHSEIRLPDSPLAPGSLIRGLMRRVHPTCIFVNQDLVHL